jgi:hypothetical protein
MKRKQGMTLEAGQRALGFFDAHADVIGRDAVVRLRELIEASVAELQAFELEQVAATGSAKGETTVQESLRRDIYVRSLLPIRVIANRALREAAELPVLKVRSRVPRDGEFVTKVIALANAAEKHEAVFIDHGMQPDFLAQLDAALADLMASTERRGRHYGRRSAATAGLKAADKSLKDNLVVADSVLKPILKSDADLLADWVASSKIHKTYVEPARYANIKLVGIGAAQAAQLHASSVPESTEASASLLPANDSPAITALLPRVSG